MIGANLLGYARWHARDSIVRALAPGALFLIMAGLPLWSIIDSVGMEAIRAPGETNRGVEQLYRSTMTLAMTLGALLIVNGVVAEDRDKGHVRFLFSSPVSTWQFYLQRYLVGSLLFVACFALVPLLFSWQVFAVPVLPVIASTALYAFLIGSLALLAGAITRRDGVVVILVTLVGSLLQSIVRSAPGEAPSWMVGLANGLPPIDTADQLRTALLDGRTLDLGDLTLVLAYALAMLVTALFIIRRASLVR